MELTFYSTAFLIGIFGSTHCLGMCGGIVGSLDAGNLQIDQTQTARICRHLVYNAGRIISYSIAGAFVGLVGYLSIDLPFGGDAPYGRLIAGLFMIALGLYLADWWRILNITEKVGVYIWKRIQPFGKHFLPAKTLIHVFGLGLVWGWLPCGLVYSVLALAMATGSLGEGSLVMISFGLGTMPMLIVMGSASGALMQLVRHPVTRKITGFCVIMFGIYTCLLALMGHGDHRHAAILTPWNFIWLQTDNIPMV